MRIADKMPRLVISATLAIVSLTFTARLAVADQMHGVFSTHCAVSKIDRIDPIVDPGMKMSAHLHQFFANRSVNKDSTYRSMRKGSTTCTFKPDTAGYWTPMLVSPAGHKVRPQGVNAYYRSVGVLARQHVRAFPANLRMISHRYFFSCGDTGTGTPKPRDCGSKTVHVSVVFPACWDGAHTDSRDHMSHMAFQTGRGCPRSHPVAVPRLVLIVRYPRLHDGTGYTLTSGRATSMHADFWNTWKQLTLRHLVRRCLNQDQVCGDMGH